MHRSTAAMQPASAILSKKRIKERAAQKKTFWGFLNSHIRRIAIEVFNLFFNHDFVFRLIGAVNKRLGIIESVFLVYPANDDYGLAYAYNSRLRRNKWIPWPVGFFRQNGKMGIKFAISAHNGDFRDSASKRNLRSVMERMEKIRILLGAKRKSFAGILPGVLFAHRLVKEVYEAEVTAEIVKRVIKKVMVQEGLDEKTPIIILGGRGFIGRRVVASLPKDSVFSVDIAGNGRTIWPLHLKGKPALLVNISLSSVLSQYLPLLWPGMVVINEVYPEPEPKVVEYLESIGCHLYHIIGVKAKALPSFPHGYKGGIPCCAARLTEEMEVLYSKVV